MKYFYYVIVIILGSACNYNDHLQLAQHSEVLTSLAETEPDSTLVASFQAQNTFVKVIQVNHPTSQEVFINTSDGTFIQDQVSQHIPGKIKSATWADINQDGLPEVYIFYQQAEDSMAVVAYQLKNYSLLKVACDSINKQKFRELQLVNGSLIGHLNSGAFSTETFFKMDEKLELLPVEA